MSALGAAGLPGLHAPQRLGGLGLGYTALALSEPGTGVHFYLPRTPFERV
jgi:hypothetical protein